MTFNQDQLELMVQVCSNEIARLMKLSDEDNIYQEMIETRIVMLTDMVTVANEELHNL